MLLVKNISATYHQRLVLEDISFQVEEGEFLGIIGPNGAGKTTLLKIITGIKAPLNGEVIANGKRLNSLCRREIAKIMAVVPQSSFIPPLWTVEDVVLMGRYPHQKTRFATTKEDMIAIEKAMGKTDTTCFRQRLVSELSGGERQMIIIARSLAQQTKMLILDEPTANLDIKHQMNILGLVKALVKEDKMTAIMVIHDLNLAARFCDRIILLHNHKIHSQGKPKDVLSTQNLKEAYEVEVMVEYNSTISALQVVVKKPFG